MARVALVEYYTWPDGALVLLVDPRAPEVMAFPADPDGAGVPVTGPRLAAYALRVLIDFHGLPPGWDSQHDRARYREALALPPAVNAAKRGGPVLERKLASKAFAYETSYLDQLAPALFPRAMREHLDEVDVLCIVPHGPLHALPFAALPWRDGELLSERFGLCTIPAASLLPHVQSRNPARHGPGAVRRFFVAAVAAVEDQDPADFEADAALAGLAGPSSPEPSVLVGPDAATKSHVMKMLRGHQVLHFACHGVFGGELRDDPMDGSGLLLSNGEGRPSLAGTAADSPARRLDRMLTAREILALDLSASELITLRACSTGRATVSFGDELLGLSRAFLFAGAPTLAASLWNVNKQSSRLLLRRFYEAWLADPAMPKWRALQLAQAAVRATDRYRHPYHWAPFVLIGDWR